MTLVLPIADLVTKTNYDNLETTFTTFNSVCTNVTHTNAELQTIRTSVSDSG